MFISRRKHDRLLKEAVCKAEERVREEFYHREDHNDIRNELAKIRDRLKKLERILEPTEGCSCKCDCNEIAHGAW